MDYLASGGSLQERDDVPDWAKNIYTTAPEISPENHVLMQAAFQKYVDSGISKTINFPNSASVQDVEDAYMLAWKKHCKGITVYRAGSREKEVMVKGINEKDGGTQLEFAFPLSEETSPDIEYTCCVTPNVVMESGCETCKACGWSACVIA